VIDTLHDGRNGYLFQTNPLGGLRDMTVTDDLQNSSWNGIWYVKTGRFEHGWTLEVAIPFKTLRYRGTGPQTWGINLRRFVKWKNEIYNGTKSEVTYSGRWGVVPRFSMEPAMTIDWVSLPFGDFTARLLSSRFTFTPSARVLVSSLVQYNADGNSMSSSVRLRWEYTGGSELFVVYSDGRNTLTTGFPAVLNRTVAIKATRLVRF
jgi:hypothetical protein